MTDQAVTNALNDVYAAEFKSLLGHLGDAQPFVSWATLERQQMVARMIAEEDAHKRELLDAIISLGGSPYPVSFSTECGAVAYLDLRALLPRVIHQLKAIIAADEAAAPRVSADPRASALVARNLEQHRRHLAELESMRREHAAAVASV